MLLKRVLSSVRALLVRAITAVQASIIVVRVMVVVVVVVLAAQAATAQVRWAVLAAQA